MKDQINIQIGGKGTGKTSYCRKLLFHGYPKRCLVLDLHNEYTEIEVLTDWNFLKDPNENGLYRVLFNGLNLAEKKEKYMKCFDGFKKGFLIAEDPFTFIHYTSNTIESELIQSILLRKATDCGLFLNIQGWSHAVDLLNLVDVLIMRKTNDIERCKLRIPNRVFEEYKSVENGLYENRYSYSKIAL